MIITRTPLRITLGGGGTDLENGAGYCVAGAVNLYVTIAVNHPCTDSYLLKYSATEDVPNPELIEHPIIRSVVKRLHVPPGVEIACLSDVPAGTGLGSSGAFTVGLLHALDPEASRPELCRIACEIDTGQQDQHAATYGGLAVYDFAERTITPIDTDVTSRLALYYTGTVREYAQQPATVFNPVLAREQADVAIEALRDNNASQLGKCLTAQWRSKLEAAPTAFHRKMESIIVAGCAAGAYGGKLIGAGGGGFLLFVAHNPPAVHATMAERNLCRVPFQLDHTGTVRIA